MPAQPEGTWENQQLIEVVEGEGAVVFSVRVQARSRRDAIEGEWQGALKIRLTAPPLAGRANEACRRLLAEHLNIPASAVRIVSGERRRTKRVQVHGVTAQQIRELAGASPPAVTG